MGSKPIELVTQLNLISIFSVITAVFEVCGHWTVSEVSWNYVRFSSVGIYIYISFIFFFFLLSWNDVIFPRSNCIFFDIFIFISMYRLRDLKQLGESSPVYFLIYSHEKVLQIKPIWNITFGEVQEFLQWTSYISHW